MTKRILPPSPALYPAPDGLGGDTEMPGRFIDPDPEGIVYMSNHV